MGRSSGVDMLPLGVGCGRLLTVEVGIRVITMTGLNGMRMAMMRPIRVMVRQLVVQLDRQRGRRGCQQSGEGDQARYVANSTQVTLRQNR